MSLLADPATPASAPGLDAALNALPAVPDAPAGVATTSGRPATLLLVDDEPSVLSALRRLFRMNGYVIEQATSGAEGLQLLANTPVDLVISDMRMPEMDGAAFLEAVRQRHPDTARILLTGYSDIGSTVAAINRGEIHRYIAKPWDDHDLLLVVSETLNKRALERRNAELQALTTRQNSELQELNRTLEQRVAARTAEVEQINGMLEQAYEEVKQNFTMAITVLSGLLEMRQDMMAGHSRRVAELARRMAGKLALGERAEHDIQLAALLHDIGKIGMPDALLARPVSKYSADELLRYHRHPLDGEAALMPLDKLHGVALIVRQHHERVDGRGFPDGLIGPAIAIGAKIISAASDYDGLTSGGLAERQYTSDLARQAIRDGVGSHYDEGVVKVLFEVLAEMDAESTADVELDVAELRPRMVLSKDLLSQQGAILLPKGYRFDAAVIKKINDFAARASLRLTVRVLLKSIEPAAPGKPGAGR